MIRLATAHAKCRLDKQIKLEDAEAAVELVQFAYFKRVLEKEKKRRKKNAESSEEDEDSDQDVRQQREAERKEKRYVTSYSRTRIYRICAGCDMFPIYTRELRIFCSIVLYFGTLYTKEILLFCTLVRYIRKKFYCFLLWEPKIRKNSNIG